MRVVRVGAQKYKLPDDRSYVVLEVENDITGPARIEREYTFGPRGDNAVRIRERKIDLGFNPGHQSVPAYEPEWNEIPSARIAEFMDHVKNPPKKGYFSEEVVPFDGFEDFYTEKMTGRWPTKKKRATRRPARKEPRNMPPSIGQRVYFADPDTGHKLMGTVVGLPEKFLPAIGRKGETAYFKRGQVLVCTDKQRPYYEYFPEFCGQGYGHIVASKNLQRVPSDDGSYKFWDGVPPQIGVVVPEHFDHDEACFQPGSTGRVLAIMQQKGTALIAWHHNDERFYTKHDYDRCFEVPMTQVRWCLLETPSGGPLQEWPFGQAPKQKLENGDMVRIMTSPLSRRPGMGAYSDVEGRELMLPETAIGKITGKHPEDRKTLRVLLAAGVDPDLLDTEIWIRPESLYKLEEGPDFFYLRGQTVEICAEVDFRGQPLKGLKGKVILPTDEDGDVGVELPEDINAGSLDGVGKQGHCLYIHAGAVKTSE